MTLWTYAIVDVCRGWTYAGVGRMPVFKAGLCSNAYPFQMFSRCSRAAALLAGRDKLLIVAVPGVDRAIDLDLDQPSLRIWICPEVIKVICQRLITLMASSR